jgi:formylglycine-generating enzyme required for sulfatase activity
MVQILGGSFVVGADRAEADEAPAHLAPAIPAFWIDLREVVNREWNSVLPQRPPRMEIVHRGDLGAGFARRRLDPQYADQPVAGVSQDDAIAYCRELGKQLPTRAEWEAASRGPWGWTFPWGENRERAKELKIVRGQQAFWEVRVPPAAIDVSVFGVRDMAGRVYEWTADGTQGASAFTFTEGPDAFRLTRRLVEPPAKFGADLGFRCVCRYTPTTNGHCAKT